MLKKLARHHGFDDGRGIGNDFDLSWLPYVYRTAWLRRICGCDQPAIPLAGSRLALTLRLTHLPRRAQTRCLRHAPGRSRKRALRGDELAGCAGRKKGRGTFRKMFRKIREELKFPRDDEEHLRPRLAHSGGLEATE